MIARFMMPGDSITQGVETLVRIPMRCQRRGGRKRIVAPDGGEITPTTKPQVR